MSKESDFIERWHKEKDLYLAWGKYLSETIVTALQEIIAPIKTSYFLKTVVEPRVKNDHKLIEKAFYRNKGYQDPYSAITDKVGTRFVVLLGSDIAQVIKALESISDWTWSKDLDYEEEQNKNPVAFEYAAVHFVVRSKVAIQSDDLLIPAGIPCEVQIKTILQHAYSELTHDTIYKPQINATPIMRRNAAKAMALLEATNDYFEGVARDVTQALSSVREVTRRLSAVYKETTGLEPKPSLLEGLLLEAYEPQEGNDYVEAVTALFKQKSFLAERIRERVLEQSPLFSQPSILLAYLAIANSWQRATSDWPLTPEEIEPMLNDLGQSRH